MSLLNTSPHSRKLSAFLILFALLLGIVAAMQGRVSATQVPAAPPPSSSPTRVPPQPQAYAGDAACAACHREQADTYPATAHHRTSSPPTPANIEGSFSKGSNVLETANPNLAFVMNAVDTGFVQSSLDTTNPAHVIAFTEPFDIVVGSGRKGHTYLYWKEDQLFELPVSYWKETASWINSPGFPDGQAHFDLPIVPRCLDCHGSYFQSAAPPLNRYLKSSLVLGISCEKCHGPGAEHVARERSATPPPHGSTQEAIVNPAHLSRDRQIDTCSLCHAGPATPIAPVLSFVPGDVITDYLKIPDPGPNAPVDVHGNQVQLLRRSKCFRSSQMTCSTCHDVHLQQRDAAALAARCLTCHQPQACGKYHEIGDAIKTECIGCHMPLQSSQVLFSNSNGKRLTPLVRTHLIAIYPPAAVPATGPASP